MAQKVAKLADGPQTSSQADGDSQRSCRPLLRQRGSSETANFGRSNGISSLGGQELSSSVCRCKGFEMDPSLCVCQAFPQRFYIGDFAEGMDESFEQDGDGVLGEDGLEGSCLRALRTIGPGGDQDDAQGDECLQALRAIGPGGDQGDTQGDGRRRALQAIGSGGGQSGAGEDEPRSSERTLEDNGFSGYQVDNPEEPTKEWRLVAADEPVDGCDQAVVDYLENLRVHLLVMDNEERAALALEVDAGEDCGTARRLRRLTMQVKQIEEVLESVGLVRADGGEFSGSCVRKVDAAEDTEDAPLHTKTVPLEVVRAELTKWVPSMISEYQSLTLDNPAVRPFTQEELDAWDKEGREYDLMPGKTVHSRKAFTGRLKTRAVVCGNYIFDSYSKAEKFASGADGVLVRCCLRVCARRAWDLGALDITTAFLLAPLLYRESRPTIVKVPKIFLDASICRERYWRVDRAMYGLRTSPKSWSSYRDATMRSMRGKFRGKVVCLRQSSADESLWYILLLAPETDGEAGGNEGDIAEGLIIVYVDDILISAIAALARAVSQMFREQWKCSPPEWASEVKEVKFNGFEIRFAQGGLELHQNSYVQDLLDRRPDIKGLDDVPAPPAAKFSSMASNDHLVEDLDKVREAQAIAGELQWLCGRCRPELTYGVNLMAQAISRDPDEALERGHQLIRFLRKHPTGGLFYAKEIPTFVGSRTTRTSPTLESFSDASFAPDGSRSQQAVQIYLDGAMVAWTSTRQAFVTMSTAESELVSICEGVTILKSLEGLIAELYLAKVSNCVAVKKVVYTDSQAALAACQTAAGNWRTRHLRIRGNMLRELLECEGWTAFHLEGTMMLADIGTKGLTSDKFWALMQMMGLDRPVSQGVSSAATSSTSAISKDQVKQVLAMMMIVALLPEAEAAQDVALWSGAVSVSSPAPNYLFLAILMIVSIASWELLKGMVRWMSRCFGYGRVKTQEEDSPPVTPRTGITPPPSPTTALPRPRQGRVRPAVRNRADQVLSKVVMTPNGTCAHATRECSTLNTSQEFVERKLCTVCCRIR